MSSSNPQPASRLGGVFAPLVTPFRKGQLDLEALRFNLQQLAQTALAGYVVLGSNGEFRSLFDAEQHEVLRVCAEEKGTKTVIAGVSAESTAQVRAAIEQAHNLGFEYAAVQAPSYFSKSMTQPVIKRFFTELADWSPLSLVLYNAPGFLNGIAIAPATVADLARHRVIAGIKDSGPTGPFACIARCEESTESFTVLAGSATFLYPGLQSGAGGGVVSLANAVPRLCCRLYQLFSDGDYPAARTLHNRLVRLNAAVSGSHGVAGVKAAMNLCGYRGGEPRPPIPALSDSDIAAIRNALQREGAL